MPRLPRPAAAGAIAATGILLLALSWGRRPDVLVDFGKELYIPWRLTEGEVLYRDIEHYLGPLSPYANAAWFTLFGVGLRTIVLANLVLLAVETVLLYRLLRLVADRFAATAATLAFLLFFGLAHPVDLGNYDFLTPYTQEATHGTILATAAVLLFLRSAAGKCRFAMAGSGLALGLAALTRPEPAVAAAAAIGIGMFLVRTRRGLGSFAAAALAPPVAAFGLLATAMPASDALDGVLRPFTSALNSDLRNLLFFRRVLGTDDVSRNLLLLLESAGWWIAALGAALLVALRGNRLPRAGATGLALACAAAAFTAATLRSGESGIVGMGIVPRMLPVFALGATALLLFRRDRKDLASTVLWVFALGMAGKILLNGRIHQYGFVHAMPAGVLTVAALLHSVPRWIAARGGDGRVFRWAALAVLAAWGSMAHSFTRVMQGRMTEPVGEGADAFLADPGRGTLVNAILATARGKIPPGATLAALPEGAMTNFLLRRRNPTRFLCLMPTEMAIFGEERIFREYVEHPPDFLLLVHKDTAEDFGPRFFGADYGKAFPAWVVAEYRLVTQAGAPPFTGPEFGILLLERRAGKR